MTEQVYNVHQGVFGALARMPKAQSEVWFLLMRVFPDVHGPVPLPRKIWADARKLVEAGIVIEPKPGVFSVNPEVVFMSEEKTMKECIDEANS